MEQLGLADSTVKLMLMMRRVVVVVMEMVVVVVVVVVIVMVVVVVKMMILMLKLVSDCGAKGYRWCCSVLLPCGETMWMVILMMP